MKDNIKTEFIINRRFIVEFRFRSNPIFFDKRGAIIDKIKKDSSLKFTMWDINESSVHLYDGNDPSEISNTMNVEVEKISFSSIKIDSVISFSNTFEKLYNLLISEYPIEDIRRIGVRIQGLYKTDYKTYDELLTKVKGCFNNNIFYKDFESNTISIKVRYKNGFYELLPISEDDKGIDNIFNRERAKKDFGIWIDTDNFQTNEDHNTLSFSNFQDIYKASLSVEKFLFDQIRK
jgi:hypothetical protein